MELTLCKKQRQLFTEQLLMLIYDNGAFVGGWTDLVSTLYGHIPDSIKKAAKKEVKRVSKKGFDSAADHAASFAKKLGRPIWSSRQTINGISNGVPLLISIKSGSRVVRISPAAVSWRGRSRSIRL